MGEEDTMAKLSALESADYLIKRAIDDQNGDLLTNLKLQKLLYYAQGCYLGVYGAPLFDDTIEAWGLGPVVPNVYHQFKVCGRQSIEDIAGDELAVDEDVAVFLDVIYAKFGAYSASRLVDMTHSEAPWKECYMSRQSVEMDKNRLMKFFVANWIDADVAIVDDGYDEGMVRQLLEAKAAPGVAETAEEVEAWLERV